MTSIEKVLINSEEYIRRLFEGIPIPIYVWQHYDSDFVLVDYNDAANKDLKGKIKKKIGMKASEFYKENPQIIQDLNNCFSRKKNLSKEREYTFKSSQEMKFCNIRYSFIPHDLVLIHIEDITEEKLAKHQIIVSETRCKQLNKELEQKVKERTIELEESEKNYRELLDNLDVGFYQVTLDGHMINLNQAHKIILGYDPSDDLKDKDVRMFWQYPEQRERYISLLLKEGSVKDYVCHSLTKDGKGIIVQLSSHLIRDKEGNPIRIDGTFIDITEKYTLGKKLEESEERYRLISENANDLIGVLNKEFKYEYINEETFFQVLGYSNSDLIGKSALDFVHPDDIPHAIKSLKDGFRKGKESDEVRFKHREGHWLWIEAKGTTFLDKDGESKALIISRDITKRKRAEQKLKESEEKFRIIAEQSFMAILIMQEFKIKYANQRLSDISGYKIDEILSWEPREFFNFIYPEEREKVIEIAEKRYKGYIDEIKDLQFRVLNRANKVKWVEIYSKTIHYKGDEADLISIMDITDKKLAEQKLKESEEKYRTVVEQSLQGICILQDFKIVFANNALAEVLGYTIKELYNLSIEEVVNLIDIEDRNLVSKRHQERLKGKKVPSHYIFRVIRKNKKIRWVEMYASLIEYNGKPAVQEVFIDITDKKLAEEKLKESETKYRAMTELLPDIIYEADLNLNITYVNKIGFQKFGYTPEDLKKGVNIKNLVSPEYIEKASSSIQSIFKGNITEPSEYLMVRKDGTKFYARIHSRPILRNKKVIGLRGTVTDINDMVIAEQKLKESEKLYREAFNRASFYKDIFAHDINNILQIMNSSAELIMLQLKDSNQIEDIEYITNIIKKQVNRGTKLVNNVRILSELEESEILIHPTKACDILLKSIEYVKKAYNERKINVKIDCPEDEIYVSANEFLQDVFENILINAVKYNENLSIDILVNIFKWKYENNAYYRFEFIDNGIGIQDDRKTLIFKRKNGKLRNDKGMGLGLSLVSKIVNYYNGKIWIEDKVKGDYSKGSKFIIILPESN